MMFNILKETAKIAKKKRADKIDQQEKAAIAKLFNDRYTFRHRFIESNERLSGSAMGGIQPRKGNAWMCPDCNSIHFAESCSFFSGLQYPSCCKTLAGHRLSHNIKI